MPVAALNSRSLLILDLDLENRPLSYLGSDWTTDEITALAWSFVGTDRVECWLLNVEGNYENGEMTLPPTVLFRRVSAIIDLADIVTGHYIRKHDLPIINGALLEYGLPPLDKVLAQDTKLDLVSMKGMSKSQENLGEALGLVHPKVHMSQVQWREANRLTPEGLRLTRERVVSDVRQHMAMREALIKQGMLKAPQPWEP